MPQLITENTGLRIQEMSDLIGAHGASDTANPPPFNGRFITPKIVAAGKTYQASIPGASDQDHPGVGQVIIDKLDKSATPPGFTKADVTDPQIVYNLTPVTIPHPSRLILWRDYAAFDSRGVSSAWYVGGVQSDSPILLTPTAILTFTDDPNTIFDGDETEDFTFTDWRTNDPSTFTRMAWNIPNPNPGDPINGIRIDRDGDYIFRYGYVATINGVGNLSSGDDPAGNTNAASLILEHFENASWQTVVRYFVGGLLNPHGEIEPAINASLFYFANTSQWGHFGDTDHLSIQAGRTLRVYLKEFNAVAFSGTGSISIYKAFFEIQRIGPITSAFPI